MPNSIRNKIVAVILLTITLVLLLFSGLFLLAIDSLYHQGNQYNLNQTGQRVVRALEEYQQRLQKLNYIISHHHEVVALGRGAMNHTLSEDEKRRITAALGMI